MAQYIDKDALVAEIRKIYNEDYKFLPSDLVESVQDFKDDLLRALDTLEVKEVDLNEEIEKCLKQHHMLAVGRKEFTDIAKTFFKLGLKARNEEIV